MTNRTNPAQSMSGLEKPAAVVSDVGRFAIIPTWLLMSGVSDRAVRLYACLAGKYANFKTQEAFPSRRTLATDLSCSLSSADRAIEELSRVGALVVERRQAANGDFISNIYKIRIATPEGQGPEESRVDPGSGIVDQGAPVEAPQNDGGVASPVTIPLVTGDEGWRHPWRVVSSPVTTQETNPLNDDQERTPPNPLAGGRPSTRKPSKAEHDWASKVLSTRGCPHEPKCETKAKCIGRLVMFQRQQTHEGMHEELGISVAPPPYQQPATRAIEQHADTS